MATVALGTKEVGSIVKLNVGGTPWEFIIVHQGKPGDMYDDSCNGVWLLMEDIYENRQWHENTSAYYESSDINAYLSSTFQNLFDSNIQEVIKQAQIPSNGSNLSCKIFLLSAKEVNLGLSFIANEGAALEYFKNCKTNSGDPKRIAKLNGSSGSWALRSRYTNQGGKIWTIDPRGGGSDNYTESGSGVRPALIFPSDLFVFEDGTVCANKAPIMPTSITVPESVQGGESLEVTWGASIDQDDDLTGYELERQVDSGDWTQIYKGEATSYTDAITRGWLTVAYRVRAYDSYELYSDYTTSPTREVNNNRAPAITCTSASGADLGTKTEGFTVSYSAADADGDPVTVTEAIDGVTLRTFTPEAEESCTFALTGETWMKILNGAHELSITASDGQAQAVHTLAFTKSVTAASVTLAQPMEADEKITLCVLSVTGSIPEDADYSVKVTNNALDDAPVWEDCTDEVKLGANHVFTNETAANGFAFNFLVSVERGESGQGGYINSVQGGFQ